MTINRISTLVPSQLPEFIRDDLNYETFVSFVEAYYEWMELANTSNSQIVTTSTSGEGVTFASKNLQNYFDIDSTIDGFVDYFTNDFLPYFPENILSDRRKVIKIAKELYQNKGTPASFNLLFRLLYNSPADVLNTNELVLKPSDGEWYIPKLLKITASSDNWLDTDIQNFRVFGDKSKAFATIERVYKNSTKYEVYISNIERLFLSGETVTVVDTHNQAVYILNGVIVDPGTPGASTITGKLVGAITTITIDSKNRGSTYNVGDPVVVYGGLSSNTGNGATAIVSSVTSGSIQRINTIKEGIGYRTNPNTFISISGTGGAIAHVGSVNTDPAFVQTVEFPIDVIESKKDVLLGNTSYYFIGMPTANIDTRLVDALTNVSFETYPISSIIVDNEGGGYNSVPTIQAESLYFDETANTHNLYSLGILGPIVISSGGEGYEIGDYIQINGGLGWGASANVVNVTTSGAITEVQYIPYQDDPTAIYPLGGIGYKIEDVLGTSIAPLEQPLNVISANVDAYGAQLYISGVLGYGAEFVVDTNRIGKIGRAHV